jgi:hypothetical protein
MTFPLVGDAYLQMSDIAAGIYSIGYSLATQKTSSAMVADALLGTTNSILSRLASNKGTLTIGGTIANKAPGSIQGEYLYAALLSVPCTFIKKEVAGRHDSYAMGALRYPIVNYLADLTVNLLFSGGDFAVGSPAAVVPAAGAQTVASSVLMRS